MATDFNKKGKYRGKIARQWASIRRKTLRQAGQRQVGLTGAALEAAIMAMAASDPSLVKIEARA